MTKLVVRNKLFNCKHNLRSLLIAPLALAGLTLIGGHQIHANASQLNSVNTNSVNNYHVSNIDNNNGTYSNTVRNWQPKPITNIHPVYLTKSDKNGTALARRAMAYKMPATNVKSLLKNSEQTPNTDSKLPNTLTRFPNGHVSFGAANPSQKSSAPSKSNSQGLPDKMGAWTASGSFDTIAMVGGHTWDTVDLATTTKLPVYCDNPDVNSPSGATGKGLEYKKVRDIEPSGKDSYQYQVLEYLTLDGGKSLDHNQKELANWLSISPAVDGGLKDYEGRKSDDSKSEMTKIMNSAKSDHNQNVEVGYYVPVQGTKVQPLLLVTSLGGPGHVHGHDSVIGSGSNTGTGTGANKTAAAAGAATGTTAATGAATGNATTGGAGGGAAGGGTAAGGATTAGGAGGSTNGTAGGTAGGGNGNNNSNEPGADNNDVISGKNNPTEDNNNNPANNNIVPEDPLVNNNDHDSQLPDNDGGLSPEQVNALIASMRGVPGQSNTYAYMKDNDMNHDLDRQQLKYEYNNLMQLAYDNKVSNLVGQEEVNSADAQASTQMNALSDQNALQSESASINYASFENSMSSLFSVSKPSSSYQHNNVQQLGAQAFSNVNRSGYTADVSPQSNESLNLKSFYNNGQNYNPSFGNFNQPLTAFNNDLQAVGNQIRSDSAQKTSLSSLFNGADDLHRVIKLGSVSKYTPYKKVVLNKRASRKRYRKNKRHLRRRHKIAGYNGYYSVHNHWHWYR